MEHQDLDGALLFHKHRNLCLKNVSQIQKPEVPVKIHLLKFKLTNLVNALKSAYMGQDIEWWDEEDDMDV